MELKKYIKRMFKPSVTKRAKAMKRARKARIGTLGDIHLRGDYQKLEKNLGYEFSDMELLKESLTHPGLVGVSKVKVKSNQRLEFLGDAILQAIITRRGIDRVQFKKKTKPGFFQKMQMAMEQAQAAQASRGPEFEKLPLREKMKIIQAENRQAKAKMKEDRLKGTMYEKRKKNNRDALFFSFYS